MFEKIGSAVQQLNHEYMRPFRVTQEERAEDLQQIVNFLEAYTKTHGIVFVFGRGKRKTAHQRYQEMFRRYLDRQLLYDLHHSHFGDRNSYLKTDVDATFMIEMMTI